MKAGTELEIKLAAYGEETLLAVGRDEVLCAGEKSERKELELRSAYYDFADGRLEAERSSLRYRSENGTGKVTFKTGGSWSAGVFSRREWEVSAGSIEEGIALLSRVAELSGKFDGAGAPVPGVTASFHRTEFETVFEGAEVSVALDRGWLESPENIFFEVEAELIRGDGAVLERLSDYLTKKYSLTDEPRSKRARCEEFRLLHRAHSAHKF